jgi:hypothetical protein
VSWRGSQKSELEGSARRLAWGCCEVNEVGVGEGVPEGDKDGQDALVDKSSEHWLVVTEGG